MALLSLRAYARHRAERGLPGGTLRAVQKAIIGGRISRGPSGLIDSEAADRAWEENTDPTPRGDGTDSPNPPPAPGEQMSSLAQASTAEKVYKARIAKLKFEERSGKLVPADDVRAEWAQLVTQSRAKVLAIPSKIKTRLPHITRQDVSVIEELIRESLEELADDDVS